VLLYLLFTVSALAAPAKKAPVRPPAAKPPTGWVAVPAKSGVPCRGKTAGKEWVVFADLDGNQTPDIARLQQNLGTHRVRLAVWMNGTESPVILDEKETLQAGNFLRLAPPGKRWLPGKKGRLVISKASLSYGACGVNEQVFHWSDDKGKFISTAVEPKNGK